MGKGTINDSGTELTTTVQNNRDSAPLMTTINKFSTLEFRAT